MTDTTHTHTHGLLPQGLGLPTDAAAALAARLAQDGAAPSFLPFSSDAAAVTTSQPPLQPQPPRNPHRFSLKLNVPEVTSSDGSFVNMVDSTRFPVSTEMAGALVRIAPGGMRQLHWHTNLNEWQFVVSGSVDVGVFLGPSQGAINGTLRAGDVGFAPRGSAHYVRNANADKPALVVLIFDAGVFTNIDVNNFLGSFPTSWTAASLSADPALLQQIQYDLNGFAPAPEEKAASLITSEKNSKYKKSATVKL